MEPPVRAHVHTVPAGAIHVVTLHRPASRNAMDTAMLAALHDALDAADRDPATRGVLLTGGGSIFSAGADLREPLHDAGRRRMELFTAVFEQLSVFRVPTAAAVEGPAVGGGAEVAAACDVRFAGRSAVFRFPGAIHGVPVGTARTIGQVGLSVARDWVLSARDVSADEAERRGFVQRLVDDGQASDAALHWLEAAAGREPGTVDLLKRLFVDHTGLRDRVAFENDLLRAQAETGALPDLERDLPRTLRPRRR